MLGNDQQNAQNKMYILKIKTTDAEKHKIEPCFQISEKNAETGKWAATGTTTSVSGDLTKLEIREQEYLGEKYNSISAYLKDNDTQEIYLLDLRLNLLSRSLCNSFLGLKDYTGLKISLYTNKKNGYPAISLRSHGELTNWAFSLDSIPAAIEVQFKGKIQRDYTPVDEFYIEKLRELSARLASGESAPAKPVNSKPVIKKEKAVKKSNPQDELDAVSAGSSDEDLF